MLFVVPFAKSLIVCAQAPHGPSQQALISAAMQQAGIAFLPFVSSHGTGTPLGQQANHRWPSYTTTLVSVEKSSLTHELCAWYRTVLLYMLLLTCKVPLPVPA